MNSNRVQCPKDVTCTTVDETSPIALIDVESETYRFPLGHPSFEHLNVSWQQDRHAESTHRSF